jgi:hypothetical protein
MTTATTSQLALTIVAALFVMALDALTPLGLAIWMMQVVLVWLTSLWATPPQMKAIATICSVFIVLGHLLSPADGTAVWVGICNLLLALAAVWAIAHNCLRQRAAEEASRIAAEELARSQATLRILSGLLPICAACKKIRNDAGSWEQMEIYIRNHSQADFTHSICEDCSARLYPEINSSVAAD